MLTLNEYVLLASKRNKTHHSQKKCSKHPVNVTVYKTPMQCMMLAKTHIKNKKVTAHCNANLITQKRNPAHQATGHPWQMQLDLRHNTCLGDRVPDLEAQEQR